MGGWKVPDSPSGTCYNYGRNDEGSSCVVRGFPWHTLVRTIINIF